MTSFPAYWAYVFKSEGYISALQAVTEGIRDGKTISYDQFGIIGLVLPSLEEQSAIATFLDRETARIDALVTEQEKLIDLLKEKRQAVISRAVTKGLDPQVPMKDSGIAWLGEVPAHWDVVRLKFISPEITVGIVIEPSKYYSLGGGVPALRSLNVRSGKIVQENLVYISEEANDFLEKSRLRKGDLVVVRSGQPGATAVIPEELDGCNCIDLIIIRRPEKDSNEFLCWYLASDPALNQFSEGAGGAIQQHFNIGMAVDLVISRPALAEQYAIARYLEVETRRIDTLILESQKAITLLKERRAALISAAVTGRIDVRDRVAAGATEAA
jgi:type I restriction enzyme S subunit